MAWIKRSTPVEQPESPAAVVDPAEEAAEPAVLAEETAPAAPGTENEAALSPRRYSKKGYRRGQHPGTAILGLIVLIFAVIGVIATIVTGFNIIKNARDTSHLKDEMYYTLLPLMQYAPTAFDDPDTSKQDALIQAALYQITNREWIRQQQNPEYVSPYKVDEFGRTAVPISAVTEAYSVLFGRDTLPYCHTFGDDAGTYFTYEYDEENQLYYVPYSSSTSAYEPAIDTIQRAGSTYKVRVGYVHLQDVTVDDHGNKVVDIAKATYFQIYTVEQLEDDSFVIRAVADEPTTEETK